MASRLAEASDPLPRPTRSAKACRKIREGRKTQIDIMQQCLEASFHIRHGECRGRRPAIVIDIKPNPHSTPLRAPQSAQKRQRTRLIDKEQHYWW